uniref:Uncharacterized protein n=1 Tax=Oryza brachyantha TaxID=4533 RepID=J3L430_ORYBR
MEGQSCNRNTVVTRYLFVFTVALIWGHWIRKRTARMRLHLISVALRSAPRLESGWRAGTSERSACLVAKLLYL